MNTQSQRIAIAEFCGWKHVGFSSDFSQPVMEDPSGAKTWYWREIPDYTNDLNAMHEAEGRLRDETVQAFEAHLNACIAQGCRVCDFSLFASDKIWNATAKQRAEAMLRTIGKWEST